MKQIILALITLCTSMTFADVKLNIVAHIEYQEKPVHISFTFGEQERFRVALSNLQHKDMPFNIPFYEAIEFICKTEEDNGVVLEISGLNINKEMKNEAVLLHWNSPISIAAKLPSKDRASLTIEVSKVNS